MSANYKLVRLRPVDPYTPGKRTYTILKRRGIPQTVTFKEEMGWGKIPTAIAEALRDEVDSNGVAVFDVCTHQEAVNLERAEEARRAQKVLKAKASAPHDMFFTFSKKASDMPMEEKPTPTVKPGPAKPLKITEPMTEVVGPEDINWDDIGVDPGPHPAEELTDERDSDDTDEPAPEPTDDAPDAKPKRRGKRSK